MFERSGRSNPPTVGGQTQPCRDFSPTSAAQIQNTTNSKSIVFFCTPNEIFCTVIKGITNRKGITMGVNEAVRAGTTCC